MIDWLDLCVLSGIEGMLGESSLVNWLVVTFQEVLIEASCTPPGLRYSPPQLDGSAFVSQILAITRSLYHPSNVRRHSEHDVSPCSPQTGLCKVPASHGSCGPPAVAHPRRNRHQVVEYAPFPA